MHNIFNTMVSTLDSSEAAGKEMTYQIMFQKKEQPVKTRLNLFMMLIYVEINHQAKKTMNKNHVIK